ncbi:DUF2125 domain-containing protein [Paracoccus limosus]|nr:DUF2125 domain-containing protein [Paracoccus limosus]
MRLFTVILLPLLILAAILAGVWLGGETLAARELARLSQAGLGFSATSITPLRDPSRIGVHLTGAGLTGTAGQLHLAEADLSVKPLSPTVLRLDLPASAKVDLGAGPQDLGLSDPRASLRLLPLSGLVPGRLGVSSGPMTLDGTPLAEKLVLNAQLAPLGHDAPPASVSAYDINLSLQGLSPQALPELAGAAEALNVSGTLALIGQGRLWLDAAPTPMVLAGGHLRPSGLRIDGAELQFGPLTARVVGMLRPDAQGRAEGALAIYTADAGPVLDAAAGAGMLPGSAVKLAGTMLRSLSAMPMPGEADGDDPAKPRSINWPAPTAGQLRLPILFADGRMSFGPIPLGPAPAFPAPIAGAQP